MKTPVLILQGATDRQVPPSEAEKLAAAFRAGGNTSVTVRTVSGDESPLRRRSEPAEFDYCEASVAARPSRGARRDRRLADGAIQVTVEGDFSEGKRGDSQSGAMGISEGKSPRSRARRRAFSEEKSRFSEGKTRNSLLRPTPITILFAREDRAIFIGKIDDLRRRQPQPFHLPGERMAAKKGGKKAAKKGAQRRLRRRAPRRRRGAKKAKKRTPNAAFMAPKQPGPALAAVVGGNPIPRTEITKKLWQYIKKNGLQDAKERRMINADDKLKAVFGGKAKVSMFEMTKLVNKHIK